MNNLHGDDIIDSRDVVKRIAELEDDRSCALEQAVDEAKEEWKDDHNGCWKDFDEEAVRADWEWDEDLEGVSSP